MTAEDAIKQLNATDKEDKPVEKEWTLGNGSSGALALGSQWFCIWLCLFAFQLGAYVKFGMIEIVGRGFIACAWLLFFWACVHVRYQPKCTLKCSPDCSYCERQRSK